MTILNLGPTMGSTTLSTMKGHKAPSHNIQEKGFHGSLYILASFTGFGKTNLISHQIIKSHNFSRNMQTKLN